VRRAAETLQGPVLLVGHSYGGAVITEAVHLCRNVKGMVYLAGFAPDKGESLAILAASGPVTPPGAAAIRPDKYGFLWIDREMFADNFCQDVDKSEALVMSVTQKPLSVNAFEGKLSHAGWKGMPCWYQVSSNDRMIPPEAEQFMAQRIQQIKGQSSPGDATTLVAAQAPAGKQRLQRPKWMGYSAISIGSVLLLYSLALKKPGG